MPHPPSLALPTISLPTAVAPLALSTGADRGPGHTECGAQMPFGFPEACSEADRTRLLDWGTSITAGP
jgi:hypothetical protein